MNISAANINSFWGSLIVEELLRRGADYFCLSPGSRSTPLTMAVANNPKARSCEHFDERGAAFHALGYARATGKPAVLICTSGTAVANYLPAIVEASSDLIPLIVLTADRPPELHGVGANQTIEQVGIYGKFVRWSFCLPCPDRSVSPEVPITAVNNAVHHATRVPAGPVHINCMFREPLAPIETGEDFTSYLAKITGWLESGSPFDKIDSASRTIDPVAVDATQKVLERAKAGVVLLGHLPSATDQDAALALANRLHWPVFADITSGLRLGSAKSAVIPYFNLALTSEEFNRAHRPDTVLHIGGRVVSKRLMRWLEECTLVDYVQIINHPFRIDPIQRVTRRIETDITAFCNTLLAQVSPASSDDVYESWSQASEAMEAILKNLIESDEIGEAGVARLLSEEITANSALFLASSMPIRDMDIFAAADGPRVPVAANRGASGIDGTVASASGYAVGLGRPVTLLIGDLALLHDLNSLALLHNCPQPMTVVVINNNGGGIFDHLPISKFGQSFEKFFVTPHGLRFEFAAKQFGLAYHHVTTVSELRNLYLKAAHKTTSCIIEVAVDRAENMQFHNRLIQEIGAALKSR